MAQLGANAHGEILEPGRVPDCYLGPRLDPPGQIEPAGVRVVEPASLLRRLSRSRTAPCCMGL